MTLSSPVYMAEAKPRQHEVRFYTIHTTHLSGCKFVRGLGAAEAFNSGFYRIGIQLLALMEACYTLHVRRARLSTVLSGVGL